MTALTMGSRTERARRLAPNAAGIVLALGLVAIGWWLAERPLVRGHGPDYQHGFPGTMAGARAQASAPAVLVRAGIPAVEEPTAAEGKGYPGDASHPAAFAVRVGDANTAAGAILLLQQIGAAAPAGTYAPISTRSTGPYAVYAGAFTSTTDADALLRSLRARGQLSETGGTVVRLPLAYLIERDVAAGVVAARVATFAARGLPVYALRQADGRAWIFAGAFSSAAESAPLGDALRTAGVRVTLAYRTGRPF